MYDTATRVEMVKKRIRQRQREMESTEFLPCLPFVYYYLPPL